MARDLTKKLAKAGWVLTKTRGGHIKAVPPDGRGLFFLAATPSDFRADRNNRSLIRRAGYAIP